MPKTYGLQYTCTCMYFLVEQMVKVVPWAKFTHISILYASTGLCSNKKLITLYVNGIYKMYKNQRFAYCVVICTCYILKQIVLSNIEGS